MPCPDYRVRAGTGHRVRAGTGGHEERRPARPATVTPATVAVTVAARVSRFPAAPTVVAC